MRREDRSSISSQPFADLRREAGRGATSLLFPCRYSSFVRAARPFLRPGLRLAGGTARRGRQGWPLYAATRRAWPWRRRARCHAHAGWDAAAGDFVHSNGRSLLRTAQAMRASLLASAIASTLWCNRFLAASIQALSP